ncbi:MAG TPA: tRNA preQ1(34) S-adenosylmethionine ribosyltransferase-isomerase QueA [Thermodesulfovibrionia bacterium]|nr:tRNA preQ1(34) S-adenosylmethionine ribosyltransferase-isomerase QueA [Thermodesulfovibrionia bacterium]
MNHERIAQHPLSVRDSSKLLVLHRKSGTMEHRVFRDIVEYLSPADVIVLNDTRVLPFRLHGQKLTGGRVEILLLKEHSSGEWSVLSKGIKEGKVRFSGQVSGKVFHEERQKMIRFSEKMTPELLEQLGTMPLPPYISRAVLPQDIHTYQTVYAKNPGAVAAPTAGLHFTEELLQAIETKGVSIGKLTLYVGYGTFRPIVAEDVEKHIMDTEDYHIPEKTARQCHEAKEKGGRVVGVGTTVTRALESAVQGTVKAGDGTSSLFIYPGYKFCAIDALVTNFHLPKSTPFILTSAFAGLELLKNAYNEAQQKEYRFFSYGDAMLIL